MRKNHLRSLLGFVLLLVIVEVACSVAKAEDLVQQVPVSSHAYTALSVLSNANLLADAPQVVRDVAAMNKPTVELTHYDFAYALIEPLEQCVAYANFSSAANASPIDRRRHDLLDAALTSLTPEKRNEVLAALQELLATFRASVDELAAGLPDRAGIAIGKMAQTNPDPGPDPVMTVHIGPVSSTDLHGNPLFTPGSLPGVMPFAMPAPVSVGPTTPASEIPVTSFETAVNVALGHFNLYSAFDSIPGESVLNPTGGTARVGLEIGLGQVNAAGVTGIFEFTVKDTHDPGAPPMDTVATTGVRITW